MSISRLLLRAPTAYARSFLFTETDDNDLTYFIVHQTQIVMKAIDDLQAYIQAKSAESRTLRADLKQMRTLNHRQQALVGHALKILNSALVQQTPRRGLEAPQWRRLVTVR